MLSLILAAAEGTGWLEVKAEVEVKTEVEVTAEVEVHAGPLVYQCPLAKVQEAPSILRTLKSLQAYLRLGVRAALITLCWKMRYHHPA